MERRKQEEMERAEKERKKHMLMDPSLMGEIVEAQKGKKRKGGLSVGLKDVQQVGSRAA